MVVFGPMCWKLSAPCEKVLDSARQKACIETRGCGVVVGELEHSANKRYFVPAQALLCM
jgi:hypothetical protein